jgi:hypothetical protein
MLKKIVTCCVMFAATFLLLSITVGDAPLFTKIYRWTSPVTTASQKFIARLVGSGWESSRDVGRKIFQNSHPKRASVSAPNPGNHLAAPQDEIPENDRERLDDLIKDYAK